jgi:hypothetical protein
MRRRGTLVVSAMLLAAAATPESAGAAHPCFLPADPQVVGAPRAGTYASILVSGSGRTVRVSWGDGTPTRSRRVRENGTIRHRYRRTGRYRIVVAQPVPECCNVSHTECTPPRTVTHRLRVRVRPS